MPISFFARLNVDSGPLHCEQSEESLLTNYKDSSRLRSSVIHGDAAKCFKNGISEA